MVTTTKANLGTIVNAVGLKGEVKLLPGPDFWPAVLDAANLVLLPEEGEGRAVMVEGHRAKGNTFVLKLVGVETIDRAASLVGCRLEAALEEVDRELLPGDLLPCQLMGLEVHLTDGSRIGKVIDMLLGSEQNCLIVDTGCERRLVPNVSGVVTAVDLEKGTIEIEPPEGLLDLEW